MTGGDVLNSMLYGAAIGGATAFAASVIRAAFFLQTKVAGEVTGEMRNEAKLQNSTVVKKIEQGLYVCGQEAFGNEYLQHVLLAYYEGEGSLNNWALGTDGSSGTPLSASNQYGPEYNPTCKWVTNEATKIGIAKDMMAPNIRNPTIYMPYIWDCHWAVNNALFAAGIPNPGFSRIVLGGTYAPL